jgi:hypothetical protein
MFFGKSKEEKKNEFLMHTDKFHSAFKLLLESDTINLVDDLIEPFRAIYDIYVRILRGNIQIKLIWIFN